MASQRKSLAFQFSKDAGTITMKDLDFASYAGDAMDNLTKENLISMITDEYNNQLTEIESTLEALNDDKKAMESGLQKATQCSSQLCELESKLDKMYSETKGKLAGLQETRGAQTQNTQLLAAQIKDLVDVRKTLNEQQIKEAKCIDNALLGELAKCNDTNIMWIVDNMTCMIMGEKGCKYSDCKDKIWADKDLLSFALRKMDNQKLPREWCENLMSEITGGKADGGAVAQAMLDPSQLNQMLPFFPLFKTLSKMVFLAMTQRKEINFKRKIASGGSAEDTINNDCDSLKSQMDALMVREVVKAEVERISEGEKGWLESKLAKTESEITKYEDMKANLLETYFGSLPQ